jgi:DsbC/DsbD-like thiol-disulfide interchange protein
MRLPFVVSLAALALAPAASAQLLNTRIVKATLLSDAEAVVPGGAFTLGVRLKIKSHWHVYWVNPGDSGDPTRVKLIGPAGFEFGPVQYPLPQKFKLQGGVTYGYEDEVLLLVPVTVGKDVTTGTEAKIRAEVSWLSCKEECIQGNASPTVTVSVGPATKPENKELFAAWRARLPVEANPAVAAVEQPAAAPSLSIKWNEPPAKVDWYPVSTPAVAIENVAVKHTGRQTQVTFKPTIYKADQLADGRVDGVLVFEDAKGQRYGMSLPVTVAKPK